MVCTQSNPNPEQPAGFSDHLNQLLRGFMSSRCFLTALELDLFTAVGNGATAENAASTTHANARAVEMLLNALVALGLLTKEGSVFRNTAESARLFSAGSQENAREGLLHTADIWHRWSNLTEAVRLGADPSDPLSSMPQWTENFIAGMQRNARDRAPFVVHAIGTAGLRRVLDLGGGSGVYSIAFAKDSPSVNCEILDLPNVVPLTTGYIKRAGVASQVSVRAGDMLHDDLGTGFELAMLNAICHMFSPEQNVQLFRRILPALVSGGRLVVQDFILDPDKTSPPHAALFSLNMLVGTASGSCYTEAEYAAWMDSAGFTDVRRINIPGPSDLIIGQAP